MLLKFININYFNYLLMQQQIQIFHHHLKLEFLFLLQILALFHGIYILVLYISLNLWLGLYNKI